MLTISGQINKEKIIKEAAEYSEVVFPRKGLSFSFFFLMQLSRFKNPYIFYAKCCLVKRSLRRVFS